MGGFFTDRWVLFWRPVVVAPEQLAGRCPCLRLAYCRTAPSPNFFAPRRFTARASACVTKGGLNAGVPDRGDRAGSLRYCGAVAMGRRRAGGAAFSGLSAACQFPRAWPRGHQPILRTPDFITARVFEQRDLGPDWRVSLRV